MLDLARGIVRDEVLHLLPTATKRRNEKPDAELLALEESLCQPVGEMRLAERAPRERPGACRCAAPDDGKISSSGEEVAGVTDDQYVAYMLRGTRKHCQPERVQLA